MGSSVNTVRQALVTLWTPAFPDALVIRGSRYLTVDGELLVASDAAGEDSSQVMAGPRRPIDEEYEITCKASVVWNGSTVSDMPLVEDRCEAIVNEAKRLVLASTRQNLGIDGVFWVIPRGRFSQLDLPASETPGGIACAREFTLAVKARGYLF